VGAFLHLPGPLLVCADFSPGWKMQSSISRTLQAFMLLRLNSLRSIATVLGIPHGVSL